MNRSAQPEDEELRTQLRNIVTRNGSAGRIPNILNDELDKLEALFLAHSKRKAVEARLDEINKAIAHGVQVNAGMTGFRYHLEDRQRQLGEQLQPKGK